MVCPRLKPFLVWSAACDEIVSIQGGGVQLYFRGETASALATVLPHLTGAALEDVASRSELEPEEVDEVLEFLDDLHLLDHGEEDPGSDDLALGLSPYTSTPVRAAAKARQGQVAVLGHGMLAQEVSDLLRASGIEPVDADTGSSHAELVVVAGDAPESVSGQSELSRGARGSIVVQLDGPLAWVGPTALAGHACARCFQHRRENLDSVEGLHPAHLRALAERPPAACALRPVARYAAALTAQEVIFVLSGARPPVLVDRVAEISMAGESRFHAVLPYPGCLGCGGPASR